jgi:hypothetical protein
MKFFATIQDGTITSTNGKRSSFNSSSTLNGTKSLYGTRTDNLVW